MDKNLQTREFETEPVTNFAHLAALHYWGKRVGHLMPQAAADALMEGLDTPALRRLAAQPSNALPDENHVLFELAWAELGHAPLSRVEAGRQLVRLILLHIVAGRVDPYAGACQIWWRVWTDCRDLDELKTFVGFASEIEDNPAGADYYRAQIIAEASQLLESPLYSVP